VVNHFALWLDFYSRSSDLELFDEVLLKQKAAILDFR